jgi:hypothetical protein
VSSCPAVSTNNAKEWATASKWAELHAELSPEGLAMTKGEHAKAEAMLFVKRMLAEGRGYRTGLAMIGGQAVNVPWGKPAVAVAMAVKFGSVTKPPAPAAWVAAAVPDVSITQLAFVCFKIHNRLSEFNAAMTRPGAIKVDPGTVGVTHEGGVAAMKALLIAEATALWGGAVWPVVGVNIVHKN